MPPIVLELAFILTVIAASVSLSVSLLVVMTNRNAAPDRAPTPSPTTATAPPGVEVIYGNKSFSGIGRKLSLSNDGEHLIVSERDRECVWLYQAENLAVLEEPIRWQLMKEYCDSDVDDDFGYDVAMCQDGLSFLNSVYEREVNVYTRATTSDPWPDLPTYSIPLDANKRCGRVVDGNSNCKVIAIGCLDYVDYAVGAILIYNRTGRESYESTQNLTVDLIDASENGLGRSLDLLGDDELAILLAGAPFNMGGNGTIHVFAYNPQIEQWEEQGAPAFFEAESLNTSPTFGRRVCISASDQGTYMVASSNVAIASNQGAVAVFGYNGTDWGKVHYSPIIGPDEEYEAPYIEFGTQISCGLLDTLHYVAVPSIAPNTSTAILQICQLQMSEGFGYCNTVQNPLLDMPGHSSYNETNSLDGNSVYGLISPTGTFTMFAITEADDGKGRIYTKRYQIEIQ